jgi:hypothetical protein
MEAKSYFNDNIKLAICEELSKATKEIYAAIAWFNDREIYEILLDKVKNGVDLNLIIANDENNFHPDYGLPFKELSDLGGKIFKLITDNTLMHHKFCVIDGHTLITGSYNWTYAANTKNLENVIVLENNIKLNQAFIQCFNEILENEFRYIEEAIEVLGLMQDEIETLKQSIRKYKEVPEKVLIGIGRIKSQNGLLNAPLDSLLSLNQGPSIKPGSNFKPLVLSNDEKVDWWKSLDTVWQIYFNEIIFKIGKVTDIPDEEGLDSLLSLTLINCSRYKFYLKQNNIGTNYEIANLNGIKEILTINSLDCSVNNISKLDAISGHKDLSKLIISSNKISSLEPLSLLSNLNHLECVNNPFTSLKGLEKLTGLNYLKVDTRFKEFAKDKDRIDNLGLIEVGQEGNWTEYRK